MDTEKFIRQIKKKLSGLSKEGIRFFAWLSAVHALSFLGTEGNFDYWKNTKDGDKRQNHLFAVLNALDATATDAATDAATTAAADAATDAAAYAAAYAADAADAYAAAYAATAAAYATAADAARTAADAARTAATAAANSKIDLTHILFQDLDTIKAGECNFQSDTAIYGNIWSNFQKALRDIDCEYWGDWYAALFAKGFILDDDDKAEIELRLNVPGEIAAQGASAVARYVIDIKEKGAARLNETRVLILGEKGSGKTSLALRLNDPAADMPKDDESTEGVDVIDWNIPNVAKQSDSEVNVHIWDFAGHVITHAAHRCFMSERCLYILLIDGRTEGGNNNEYWLEQIRNYGVDSPTLVVVNVRDDHPVDIPENTLKKEFPFILDFYKVNIQKGGHDLEDFRQVVMNHLRDNPLWKNQKISTPAYKVKEALRSHFTDGKEYIHRDEFDRIANDNNVAPEEHEQLLRDLHSLGICLWYDKDGMHKYDMMVLNPSWISHGIYRLINWGLGEKEHVLSIEDFPKIFTGDDADRYPHNKADFLFRLMETYQLAFSKDAKRISVPLLLPADRPVDGVLPEFPFGERLRMEYRAEQALPPYTVSRLAVLHSQELDEQKSWRFGALLRWGDTDALVKEDERMRSVIVSVIGPERTEYISRLRDSLSTIFNDYKSNRPELKYEVLLPEDFPTSIENQLLGPSNLDKFLQPEGQILGNANIGQKLVIDGSSLPPIDPAPTIQAYNVTNNYNYITINGSVRKMILGPDNSQTNINIRFNDCSINLQGELNSFAKSIRNLGNPEDAELADELEVTASTLDAATNEIPANAAPDSPEMVGVKTSLQKNGLLRRLENLYDELNDENSELHKKATKIRKGVETVQKLGTYYNDVAQWFGLPQVPRPFLGQTGKK